MSNEQGARSSQQAAGASTCADASSAACCTACCAWCWWRCCSCCSLRTHAISSESHQESQAGGLRATHFKSQGMRGTGIPTKGTPWQFRHTCIAGHTARSKEQGNRCGLLVCSYRCAIARAPAPAEPGRCIPVLGLFLPPQEQSVNNLRRGKLLRRDNLRPSLPRHCRTNRSRP